MVEKIRHFLESTPIAVSAPCRIDMGGTVDIRTFYFPLGHLEPCTFNIAIDLCTTVRILPYESGRIKVSSQGFDDAEYGLDDAPFDHPLGLIFAIAAYFRIDGIHISVESASPPKSALGGSSVAAVGLIAGITTILREVVQYEHYSKYRMATLAHAIEESVAGVPCGMQDHLAAVYGGVNAWYWKKESRDPIFWRKTVVGEETFIDLEKRLLIAYCGVPHVSKDINKTWTQQFISGKFRKEWKRIIECTQSFVKSISGGNYSAAVQSMNEEVSIRQQMTPHVLDDVGKRLVQAATNRECGARFTGAGGGGCLWALGEPDHILALKTDWEEILSVRKDACLLPASIDSTGLVIKINS